MTDTDLITAPAEQESAGTAGPDSGQPAKTRARAARTGLSGMVLSELRTVAGELGIKGTSGMRKGDLIAAIKERQGGGAAKSADAKAEAKSAEAKSTEAKNTEAKAAESAGSEAKTEAKSSETRRRSAKASSEDGQLSIVESAEDGDSGRAPRTGRKSADAEAGEQRADEQKGDEPKGDAKGDSAKAGDSDAGEQRNRRNRNQNRDNQNREGGQNRERGQNREGGQNRDNQNRDGGQNRDNQNRDGGQNRGGGQNRDNRDDRDDDGEGGGRRRGRRFRERRRGRDRDGGSQNEPQVSEDDVLQPVAGILDVLDNYAFVRTSGYLAGSNDVYVSMNMVRKNGLRRGDAITGAVKVPREGDQQNQRQKFNPLVRLDTVNGGEVEAAKKRPEFNKLTPLYPNQRLRLETTPDRLSTRVIDLIMPIGKGQRALIVSPPKAGKTTILQDIANAITVNNPECHLMVVLVDERPEEVTDMQRSVKGEVIASTFDRPPSDHTSVAELAIERAKRLVESGKDVVVLLDSITRLGRAYNNASPASGRILSGGVDSTALYPPKRFLGAARNIENGGSLTIIATAMVETGSTGDTVIFEEFKGTGNAELKLDRKISERRVFPAVDVNPSGTRKDELLLSPDEFAIVHKLRRLLSGLDSQQAIDLLISQLKKTKTNIEFLMSVQKTAPGAGGNDD
ncbi:transcription termination factor Rho [Gordonia alkanivorans]|uniref:transcription termination factor Rho n=1 Tax=Gordonia alkanivorans TaxID=84096 RepID=UPI000FDE5236|nr:transcription termination factor Rho [Gordonia alkanivorans]AZZ82787.1 transcription termination factor Rho [Gordonia alkanivorans]